MVAAVDSTLKFALSALWNLTDETPAAAENFLSCQGLELYEEVLEVSIGDADDCGRPGGSACHSPRLITATLPCSRTTAKPPFSRRSSASWWVQPVRACVCVFSSSECFNAKGQLHCRRFFILLKLKQLRVELFHHLFPTASSHIQNAAVSGTSI